LGASWTGKERDVVGLGYLWLNEGSASSFEYQSQREKVMKKFILGLKRFVGSEEAVTAIEYALLAALIAVAVIGGASMLGGNVQKEFTSIAGVV
jgi:pilus assembly protein Flp/PilA